MSLTWAGINRRLRYIIWVFKGEKMKMHAYISFVLLGGRRRLSGKTKDKFLVRVVPDLAVSWFSGLSIELPPLLWCI